MRKLIKRTCTRKAAKWFLRSTLLSWLIQGILFALFAIVGVGTVAALVSAKATAYTVWFWQCIQAARN